MESLTYIRHRIKTPPPPSCRRRHHTTAAYHRRAAPLVTAAAMWCSKQKGRGDTILRIWTFSSEEKIGSTFFVMHAEKRALEPPLCNSYFGSQQVYLPKKNRDDRTEMLQGLATMHHWVLIWILDGHFLRENRQSREDAWIQLQTNIQLNMTSKLNLSSRLIYILCQQRKRSPFILPQNLLIVWH